MGEGVLEVEGVRVRERGRLVKNLSTSNSVLSGRSGVSWKVRSWERRGGEGRLGSLLSETKCIITGMTKMKVNNRKYTFIHKLYKITEVKPNI